MSQNKSLGHIRDHTMDQMEIRTADGSGSHLDDNIIIILYLRISPTFFTCTSFIPSYTSAFNTRSFLIL